MYLEDFKVNLSKVVTFGYIECFAETLIFLNTQPKFLAAN